MTKYAKLRRNIIRAGLLAALVFNIQVVRAAYSQVSPPAGWSPVPTPVPNSGFGNLISKPLGGSAGAGGEFAMLMSKPVGGSAGATISSGRISALASLSVNGRAISVPAKMALAPTAARVAAGIVFMNPALRTIGLVAGWLGAASLVYDIADGIWKFKDPAFPVSDGFEYGRDYRGSVIREPNRELACDKLGPLLFVGVTGGGGDWQLKSSTVRGDQCVISIYNPREDRWDGYGLDIYQYPGKCPAGSYSTPEGCVMQPPLRPVDSDEFDRVMEREPMPEKLPEVFPHSLPVKLPEIQPLFIPTGNPVPNPNYDPSAPASPSNQPYNQPGVRVVPAPTTDDPWRIDLQPTDRPTTSPDPTGPVPDDGSKPGDKPSDDKPGLCDMYPDILACAKPELDTPGGEIPKSQRSVELSDSDLFGGGACPANVYATISHQYLQVWNWDQSCYYIVKYLKPVILVLGAFTALMIVSGGTKE